jgi:hypothetical protein
MELLCLYANLLVLLPNGSTPPSCAPWDQQVANLGKLYWRRNRIERMETGLMRDALKEVEERR